MPTLAARMDAIEPSATVGIADLVAKRRREGADIISLSLGEPDFDTPSHVREAAKRALDEGQTHYTPGAGIPELRKAIAANAVQETGIPCRPDHVLVTPTKHAVMMTLQSLVGPGDEVLVPDPGWVSYAPATKWAQATPVPVPLDASFRMTADAVRSACTRRTRLLILNSPSNPTGGVDRLEEVRKIMDVAAERDLWVLSDEIYRKLIYEGRHVSPASLPDAFARTVTVDGLSKSFAMTGWRVGWAIAPLPVLDALNRLQSHSVTHATSFAQYAAVTALTGPQDSVTTMRDAFAERRRIMVDGLNALPGVDCQEPAGAFYAFPRFDPETWGGDDTAVCRRLIERAGVAATPGSAFGARGANHIRFSYAAAPERIAEGLRRMARLVQMPA